MRYSSPTTTTTTSYINFNVIRVLSTSLRNTREYITYKQNELFSGLSCFFKFVRTLSVRVPSYPLKRCRITSRNYRLEMINSGGPNPQAAVLGRAGIERRSNFVSKKMGPNWPLDVRHRLLQYFACARICRKMWPQPLLPPLESRRARSSRNAIRWKSVRMTHSWKARLQCYIFQLSQHTNRCITLIPEI